MAAYGLIPVYDLTISIGVSKSADTWTYAELADGIDNIAEALNEVVQQYFFLSDDGFARNHVTGMAPSYTLTGRRVVGDTAQDYIFGNKFKLDTDRQTSIKILGQTDAGAAAGVTCDATICNVQEFGGATTDDNAISFEIRFDGKPTSATE